MSAIERGSRAGRKHPHIKGCFILELPTHDGVERLEVTLIPGVYDAEVGFREFGHFEEKWFSAASDNAHVRERPFVINPEHPKVVRFCEELFSAVRSFPNDAAFVADLDRVYSRLLPSATLDHIEHYESLSDIVQSGTGTCAAKVLLLGVALTRRYPHLQVSEIYGQASTVGNRVQHPFGHVWLRIESETYVFLYDPMYSKVACFLKGEESFTSIDEGYDVFLGYSVQALPVSSLDARINFSKLSANLQAIEASDGLHHQLFVDPADQDGTLAVQIEGRIPFRFALDHPATLEVRGGSIQSVTRQGAALHYPLLSIKKEDE